MREAAWVLIGGLTIGLATAWAASRIVRSQLYGVEPGDPLSHLIAVIVLAAAGVLAAWIPARRASRVDPIRALRYE
jgi:ABC-type antimicrobial peptide transport system permease subunit